MTLRGVREYARQRKDTAGDEKKNRKKYVKGYGNSLLLTATGRENSDRNEKDDEQNKKGAEAKGKK